MTTRVRLTRLAALLLATALVIGGSSVGAAPSESYQRISGSGSSWAAGAINTMAVNVKQFGITVNYNPTGSSAGRSDFLNGVVDFAASDIPFQFRPEDGSAPERPARGSYAYIPVTAGGTSFMYNLKINGQRVTNLRLSGENVAKIFTGAITTWNDPALRADNPGLALPARKIVPVVRSDGSGSSAQFTKWMISQHKGIWDSFCARSGRAPACGSTSFYPTVAGIIAQSGDLGISGYVSQSYAEGAIGYVNYSYALGSRFPVAKVLNSAGYYTEPTPENVSVSLLKAQINTNAASDDYLTQNLEGVYRDADKRNYPLSSYSYFILPTKLGGTFNTAKGKTLGAFAYYAMCQAQQQSASLGYSPLPINLVQSSFEQIRKIPGVVVQDISISSCKNPTFSPDGTNVLAQNAALPPECDRKGPTQCATGTGGVKSTPTAVASAGGTTGSGTGSGAGTGTGANAGGASNGSTGTTVPGATGGDGSGAACEPDPDTGLCPDGSGGSGGSGSALVQGAVTTTLLSNTGGWSSAQTLMIVVFGLTLLLILAPAAAWRHLSRKEQA